MLEVHGQEALVDHDLEALVDLDLEQLALLFQEAEEVLYQEVGEALFLEAEEVHDLGQQVYLDLVALEVLCQEVGEVHDPVVQVLLKLVEQEADLFLGLVEFRDLEGEGSLIREVQEQDPFLAELGCHELAGQAVLYLVEQGCLV